MKAKDWSVPSYHTVSDGVGCGHDHISMTAAIHCAENRLRRSQEQHVRVVQRHKDGSRTLKRILEPVSA